MSVKLAKKKVLGEAAWSIVTVAIMVAGLTGWIVIPAVGYSLESGLSNYANASGTYVIVSFNGNPLSQQSTLPTSAVNAASNITGVQTAYPIDVNFTTFQFPNYTQPPPPGGGVGIRGANQFVQSAMIGGRLGFPTSLIGLVTGRLPGDKDAGFVSNSPTLLNLNNQGHPFALGDSVSASIGNVNFSASVTGVNAYNPLIGNQVLALWNPTFFQSILGQKGYNETFGAGANLLILKVASVGQVAAVASQVMDVLKAYPDYNVTYDQATVNNLVSIETGSGPLYELIGAATLSSSVAAVLFVSYVSIKRRSWEVGLLLSQGWTWSRVTNFFWGYFLLLGAISYVLSMLISYLISLDTTFTFQVYGATLQVQATTSISGLVSAGLIALGVTVAATVFMRWRLHGAGLDAILREY